jgi:hypothetical protein
MIQTRGVFNLTLKETMDQLDRCIFISIPQDILNILASYFLPVDECRMPIFRYSAAWRNFMNTSKEQFGRWKKQSQLLFFNWLYSRMLCRSVPFRNRVLESVEQPDKQVMLNFVFPDRLDPSIQHTVTGASSETLSEINQFIVNSIMVQNLLDLDVEELLPLNWSHARKLTVMNSTQADGTFLKYLFELTITGGRSGLDFKNYHLLSNLSKINISYCQTITDVSCFQKVRHLSLHGCHQISDVSALGNVRDLSLVNCRGILDVSALENVRNLNLSYCVNIRDVSNLGRVHKLNLCGCSKIHHVAALGSVYDLNLRACYQVSDVSALRNVHILDVSNTDVADFSSLTSVHSLTFHGFEGSSLRGLENSVHVTVSLNPLRSLDISALHVVKKLEITQVTQFPRLLHLKYLKINENFFFDSSFLKVMGHVEEFVLCDNSISLLTCSSTDQNGMFGNCFVNISLMKNLTYLELQKCKISDGLIVSLPRLETLSIQDCSDLFDLVLKDLPCLSHVYIESVGYSRIQILEETIASVISYVKIEHCFNLEDIVLCGKVFQMKVTCCQALRGFSTTKQIGHLVVAECGAFQTRDKFSVGFSSINEAHTTGDI